MTRPEAIERVLTLAGMLCLEVPLEEALIAAGFDMTGAHTKLREHKAAKARGDGRRDLSHRQF